MRSRSRAGCARVVVAGEEIVVASGDRQHTAAVGQAQGAVQRLVQQRFAVGHAHERLGIRAARHRPEAGSGAAGENHRYQHVLFLHFYRDSAALHGRQFADHRIQAVLPSPAGTVRKYRGILPYRAREYAGRRALRRIVRRGDRQGFRRAHEDSSGKRALEDRPREFVPRGLSGRAQVIGANRSRPPGVIERGPSRQRQRPSRPRSAVPTSARHADRSTTRTWSRSRARRSIVPRKFWPRAAYTQAVRKMKCAQPELRSAISPASLLRPYAPSGAIASSSRYGLSPWPSKT